jgi:hypothetical protein
MLERLWQLSVGFGVITTVALVSFVAMCLIERSYYYATIWARMSVTAFIAAVCFWCLAFLAWP